MAASELVRRGFSTLVLWGVVLAVILTGWSPGFAIVVPTVGGIALAEFFQALSNKGIRSFRKSGIAGGVFFLLGSWVLLSDPHRSQYQPAFELLCLLVFLLGVLSRQVFDRTQQTPVVTMAVTLLGMLYIPWLLNFVTHLAYLPQAKGHGNFLILYLLLVTKITDIGAYITGKFFGKHKLLPAVSPKKTWEGFIGGLVCSLLASWLLVRGFPEQLHVLQRPWTPLLAFFISIISVVGDLAESVVKRDTDVKDSGALIPGIGGALDLVDSVLFTAPVLYVVLTFVK
jgi:phosphatidate cytidylyltransferase